MTAKGGVELSKAELDGIKLKMKEDLTCDGERPLPAGCTETIIEQAIEEYCKFLALHAKFPEQVLVPSGWIDKAWHSHLMFTRMYAATCDKLFGKFFHHDPCVNPQERRQLLNHFEETLENTNCCSKQILHLACGHSVDMPTAWTDAVGDVVGAKVLAKAADVRACKMQFLTNIFLYCGVSSITCLISILNDDAR